MSVITAEQVEKARDVLVLAPGDVITPLARDRAKELGIRIERSGPATAATRATPGATAATRATPGATAATRATATSAPATRSGVAAGQSYSQRVGTQNQAQSSAQRVAAGAGRRVTSPALPPASAPVPAAAPPLPRSGALYRRGAYGPQGERSIRGVATGAVGDARPQVAVVGAGHVGAATGFRLAETDRFARVTLIDVVPGLAAGLALDMWHSAGLRGFTTRVEGSDGLDALAGVDIVVVTAGRPRKPGMSRTDLTLANSEIIRSIAPAIKEKAPNAAVVVVTNPLEEMTHLMGELTGFPAERVTGMGGVLDTARFRSLVGLTGLVRPEDVQAFVIGSHGPEMVIPLSQAFADGVPLEELFDRASLDAIVARTRESGAEVGKLLQTGSAFFSPASSIAEQVAAIADGSDTVIPACVRSRGAYGLADTRVGLPVRLGPAGVREIVELALRPEELAELRESAQAIETRIKSLT